MWQNAIMLTIVVAALLWLAWQAYRFLRPSKNTSGCPGGCGCNSAKTIQPTPPPTPSGQTVFLPFDDLIRRLQARKQP